MQEICKPKWLVGEKCVFGLAKLTGKRSTQWENEEQVKAVSDRKK
jgi:hypothetical protein